MVANSISFPKEKPEFSVRNDYKTQVVTLPPPEKYANETPTEYRFRLLRLAQRVQGSRDHRLNRCHQQLAPNTATVEVRRTPGTDRAHFRGLYVCNRGWTCPCCAMKISNKRREELTTAFVAAKKLGFSVLLITYTLRHSQRDDLEPLWKGLQGAYSRVWGGDGGKDLRYEYDAVGAIRALETLYGDCGWHPHIHQLLFVKKVLSNGQIAGLKKWLTESYMRQLEKGGYNADFEYGIDIRTAESDIAEYITKYGREPKEKRGGADFEVAKLATKREHSHGVTPFQLLEAFGEGDKRGAALFQEYATAMEKRQRLVWSPGLRKLLTLPEELSDEQLPLIEDEQTYTAVEFNALNWKKVCAYEIHELVLALVAVGAIPALQYALRRRGIDATYYDQPEKVDIVQIPLPAAGSEINAPPIVEPKQMTLPGISTGANYA